MSIFGASAAILLMQASVASETCNAEVFYTDIQQRSDKLDAEIQSQIAEMREIMRQRSFISERLLELANGRHRLRGLVDLNYDANALRRRDEALTERVAFMRQRTEFIEIESQLLRMELSEFRQRCSF